MHRFRDNTHTLPVRLQFQQEPIKVPARKESITMQSSPHIGRTVKKNQYPMLDNHYLSQTMFDSKKSPITDISEINRELLNLRTQMDSIKVENRKLSLDQKGLHTPAKSVDMMSRTQGDSTTFVSRNNVFGDTSIHLGESRHAKQSQLINKKMENTHLKNNSYECLLHSNEFDNSKTKQSQISSPFSESYSDVEKLLQSAKLLQNQQNDVQGKRIGIQQIQFNQDQKIKDKDSLINILASKLDQSAKQYQRFEKQISAQNRRLQQLSRKPQNSQRIHLIQIIAKKDKELSQLKLQAYGTKQSQKRNHEISTLNIQYRKLIDDFNLKQKQLTRQKQAHNNLKGNQQQLLKKVKQETLQQISYMQKQISNLKSNLQKTQSANQDMIKALKSKVLQLTTQLNNKNDTFVKEKDHIMKQLVSHQATIKNLQQDIQKGLIRQKSIQQNSDEMASLFREQQQFIKKQKDVNQNNKWQTDREAILQKDKQTYQKLLVSQQASIKILRAEIQTLKDEANSFKSKSAKQSDWILERQALHKQIVEKQSSISDLKTQIQALEKQLGQQRQNTSAITLEASKSKGLQLQRESWSNLIKNQQLTIKRLREEVQSLTKQTGRQKYLNDQKQSLSKLIQNQQQIIKNCKQQNSQLNFYINKNSNIYAQKDYWTKLAADRQSQIKLLKETNNQLKIQGSKQRQFQYQKEGLQKLIKYHQSVSKQSKQQINKLNIQLSKSKINSNQKQGLIKIIQERQSEIKFLRQQTKQLDVKSVRQKEFSKQREGYLISLSNNQNVIRQLRQQVAKLNSQLFQIQSAASQKQKWFKLARQRQIQILKLKDESRDLNNLIAKQREHNYMHHSTRQNTLAMQKQSLERIVKQQNQTIKYLNQRFNKTNETIKPNERQTANSPTTSSLELEIKLLNEEVKRQKQTCMDLYQKNSNLNILLNKLKVQKQSGIQQLKILQQQNQRLIDQKNMPIIQKSELSSKYKQSVKQLKTQNNHNQLTQSTQQKSLKQQISNYQAIIKNLQNEVSTTKQLDKKVHQLQKIVRDYNNQIIAESLSVLNRRLNDRGFM